MKTQINLIALLALTTAAGAAVAEGAAFTVEKDEADTLIKDAKAKVADPAPDTEKKDKATKARLLIDCEFGKCNDVVTLNAADLKAAQAAGIADPNKDAVAYASTLPQNQPKKG